MSNRPVWALDTVGVDHPAADARANSLTSNSGESGLIAYGGGGLVATPGNSASVRVLPCSVVAVSRSPGHVGQSYSFRVQEAEDVPIRPAASSPASGRTDAIILRVFDPAVTGDPIAEDPNAEDYWKPHVIEGVPPTTGYTEDGIAARFGINYPFVLIGLARVEAGQSAVAEINFLANAINPRSRPAVPQIVNFGATSQIGNTGTVYKDIGTPAYFDVPRWATHVTYTAIVNGVHLDGSASSGWLNATSGGTAMPEPTRWDIDPARDGFTRTTLGIGGQVWLAPDKRGAPIAFQLRASNSGQGLFGVGQSASMMVTAHFEQSIDMNWG